MRVLHERTLTIELEVSKRRATGPPISALEASSAPGIPSTVYCASLTIEGRPCSRCVVGLHLACNWATDKQQSKAKFSCAIFTRRVEEVSSRTEPRWLPSQFGTQSLNPNNNGVTRILAKIQSWTEYATSKESSRLPVKYLILSVHPLR